MIQKYYTDINLYRFKAGYFEEAARYKLFGTFKGLIQTPNNSKTYNNGKDSSTVTGILFCSSKHVFEEKDIIECDGNSYKIAGVTTQSNGVAGIKPQRGQHSEYSLIFTQNGIKL